jgi:hypothetical protein
MRRDGDDLNISLGSIRGLRVEWACRAKGCGHRFVARIAEIEQGGACPQCHTVATSFGPAVRPAYR